MAIQLIPITEVLRRTSVSRATLYRLIKSGDFPKQVKVGLRRSGWRESDVDQWLESKCAA